MFAAISLLGVLAYTLWPATPDPVPSNPVRDQRPVTVTAGGWTDLELLVP